MKILLLSPIELAYNSRTRYGGIERLVWEYSNELRKRHTVTVQGHKDSEYPEGVEHLPCSPEHLHHAEVGAYQRYSYLYRGFDVIHDFSHLHLAARFMKLPVLSIFWHAPGLAGWSHYTKASYNIIALSKWAEYEFIREYRQGARYQQSIVMPEDYYQASTQRGSRFLTLGRMGPEKGNLMATTLAVELGIELDIVGGAGTGAYSEQYVEEIKALCDGEKVAFRGEVDEEEKLCYLRTARALLYITGHPEVTSHKCIEALACGCPVIVPAIGAMPELVQHGYNGFLCTDKEDYIKAIEQVESIDPEDCRKSAEQWRISRVVADYEKLYEAVAGGEKW